MTSVLVPAIEADFGDHEPIQYKFGDTNGSPSKLKRRRAAVNSEQFPVDSRQRTRCFFLIALLIMLTTGLIIIFAVLIANADMTVGDHDTSQDKVQESAYALCPSNWVDTSYDNFDLDTDPLPRTETPCSALDDQTKCMVTINCCWVENRCGTYRQHAECSELLTKEECEVETSFCAWRGSLQECRRADREKEKKTNHALVDCESKWLPSKLQPELRCRALKDESGCSVQPGCCWEADVKDCRTVTQKRECGDVQTMQECVNMSKLCSWRGIDNGSGNKCVRTIPQEFASIRPSIASVPTTFPTIQGLRRKKQSFLILLADDLGWGDVTYTAKSPFYSTPHIDEMARGEHSIEFTRFHSAAISCSPTRASLLSMRNNILDCVWGANSRWDKPNIKFRAEFPFQGPVNETLGVVARKRGYRTLFLGKWHISAIDQDDIAKDWGFDSWTVSTGNLPTYDSTCFCQALKTQCFKGHYPHASRLGPNYDCNVFTSPTGAPQTVRSQTSADYFVDRFDRFLRDLDTNDPFFAIIGFNEPHAPFIASPAMRAELLNGPLQSSSDRSVAADYYGAIMAMDAAVGRTRQLLANHGRQHDTFVLFTSDNGPEEFTMGGYGSTGGLRGRKRSMYEGGHRVPGILEWPRYIRGNIVSNSVISMLDISVTIMDIILQEERNLFENLVQNVHGESLVPSFVTSLERQGGFQYDRLSPIFICAATVSGDRRACPSMAVIVQNYKLVGNVRPDGSLNRTSTQLFDYEVSEYAALPQGHPQFEPMWKAANAWGKDIIGHSSRYCWFPSLV